MVHMDANKIKDKINWAFWRADAVDVFVAITGTPLNHDGGHVGSENSKGQYGTSSVDNATSDTQHH